MLNLHLGSQQSSEKNASLCYEPRLMIPTFRNNEPVAHCTMNLLLTALFLLHKIFSKWCSLTANVNVRTANDSLSEIDMLIVPSLWSGSELIRDGCDTDHDQRHSDQCSSCLSLSWPTPWLQHRDHYYESTHKVRLHRWYEPRTPVMDTNFIHQNELLFYFNKSQVSPTKSALFKLKVQLNHGP